MNTREEILQAFADYQKKTMVAAHGQVTIWCGEVTAVVLQSILMTVLKVSRCGNCQTRLNPDQWERVDKQVRIALMLLGLNIDPHPPPITAAGQAGKQIKYPSE